MSEDNGGRPQVVRTTARNDEILNARAACLGLSNIPVGQLGADDAIRWRRNHDAILEAAEPLREQVEEYAETYAPEGDDDVVTVRTLVGTVTVAHHRLGEFRGELDALERATSTLVVHPIEERTVWEKLGTLEDVTTARVSALLRVGALTADEEPAHEGDSEVAEDEEVSRV